MKIDILYEDEDVVVVRKEAGLATQAGRASQADVVSELKNHIVAQKKKSGIKVTNPYLGVVHRLDQPVEGVLVFGKTPAATANLNTQLQNKGLNKQYYAVVCGKLDQAAGKLVDYLIKDSTNVAKVVSESVSEAKQAILTYKVLQEDKDISCMDIRIETGRFHQIRVQMAHAGFPLLGDSKYGTDVSLHISEEKEIKNVALCAYKISFSHPRTGTNMEYSVSPKNKAFADFKNYFS